MAKNTRIKDAALNSGSAVNAQDGSTDPIEVPSGLSGKAQETDVQQPSSAEASGGAPVQSTSNSSPKVKNQPVKSQNQAQPATAAAKGEADMQKSVMAASDAQKEKDIIDADASVVSVIPGSESEGRVAGALKLADDKAINAGGDALDNVARSHIRGTADYQALQKGNASGLDEQKTLAIISALENPNERQRDLYTPDQIAVRLQFFRDHLDDLRSKATSEASAPNGSDTFSKQQNTFIRRNLNDNIFVPGKDVSASEKDVNSKAMPTRRRDGSTVPAGDMASGPVKDGKETVSPQSGTASTPSSKTKKGTKPKKGSASKPAASTGTTAAPSSTTAAPAGEQTVGKTDAKADVPGTTVASAKPVGKTSDGHDVYLNTDGVGAYYIDPKTKRQIPVAVDYKRKDYTEADKKEDEGISAELQKKIDDATAKFNEAKATISDKNATYGDRVKAIQEQMKLSRTLEELTNPSYEKKANARRLVAVLADAFASIGNMVSTAKGGHNVKFDSMTAKVDKAEKEKRTQLNKELEYWNKRLETARKSDAAAAKLYSNGALKDATEAYKQACKAAIEDTKSRRTLVGKNRTLREKNEAAMEKKVASWNKFVYDTAKENQRQVNRVSIEGIKHGNSVSLEDTKYKHRTSEIHTRGEEARKTKKTQSGGSKDSGDIKI